MIGDEVFHVAVMPPSDLPSNLVSQIAQIVNQPEYQIRFQLAGHLPRMIGHFKEGTAANTAARSLLALNLAAFVISESELRRTISPELSAHSIKIDGEESIFTNRNGKFKNLSNSNVFLILTGRRSTVVEEETVAKSTMKVNVTATLLTGGIPVMKRVVSKAQESKKITEQFVRLYTKESDVPAVELCQFDLDYSFLGDKKGPTATGNINASIDVLRQAFPKAFFDNSLLTGFVTDSKSISGTDLGEQNCFLLVRYYKAMANDSPGEAI